MKWNFLFKFGTFFFLHVFRLLRFKNKKIHWTFLCTWFYYLWNECNKLRKRDRIFRFFLSSCKFLGINFMYISLFVSLFALLVLLSSEFIFFLFRQFSIIFMPVFFSFSINVLIAVAHTSPHSAEILLRSVFFCFPSFLHLLVHFKYPWIISFLSFFLGKSQFRFIAIIVGTTIIAILTIVALEIRNITIRLCIFHFQIYSIRKKKWTDIK